MRSPDENVSQGAGNNSKLEPNPKRPGGPWSLVALLPDPPSEPVALTCTTPEQVEKFVLAHNESKGVYYSVNPATSIHKKPAKQEISRVEYLHSDSDPAANETPNECWARLQPQITDPGADHAAGAAHGKGDALI
jgi:hypothetical protein